VHNIHYTLYSTIQYTLYTIYYIYILHCTVLHCVCISTLSLFLFIQYDVCFTVMIYQSISIIFLKFIIDKCDNFTIVIVWISLSLTWISHWCSPRVAKRIFIEIDDEDIYPPPRHPLNTYSSVYTRRIFNTNFSVVYVKDYPFKPHKNHRISIMNFRCGLCEGLSVQASQELQSGLCSSVSTLAAQDVVLRSAAAST